VQKVRDRGGPGAILLARFWGWGRLAGQKRTRLDASSRDGHRDGGHHPRRPSDGHPVDGQRQGSMRLALVDSRRRAGPTDTVLAQRA
jgi:hypothetical protein